MSKDTFHDARPAKRRRLSPTPSDDERSFDRSDDLQSDDVDDIENGEDDEGVQFDEADADAAENDDQDANGHITDSEDELEVDPEEEGGVPINGRMSAPATESFRKIPISRPHPATNIARAPTTADAAPTSSGLFKLQIDELLRQVRPNYDKIQGRANDVLRKIETVIESIPERPALPLKEVEKDLLKSHKVAVPFLYPRPTNDIKYKFGYARPTSVNVVGSYASKTATKQDSGISVDLVVHMPEDLFEAKDYLNYRYFHKRAYYVACLAAGLKASSDFNMDLEFSVLNDNALLPVLLVRPRNDEYSSKFSVQIMPVTSADLFPLDKTLPARNCVRTISAKQDDTQRQPPTPFYNATLRSDCAVNGYLKLLHATNARCAGFREACMLGRVWLQQRGLGSSVAKGGFGGFEWATLMALLLETGGAKGRPMLPDTYNSMQLFGGTLHFLTQRDLAKKPLVVGAQGIESEGGVPMLFDYTRGLNVLYSMTSSSYRTLREEARIASKLFGTNAPSRFESLFITKVAQPLLHFDMVFQASIAKAASHSQSLTIEKLHDTMTRGLGDRANSVHVWATQSDAWSINATQPQRKNQHFIGLILDPANSARSVDRGPSAEDIEGTRSFQDFWGYKAELRRFKDGQIRESLVWSTNDPIEVTKEIVLFLLQQHAGLKSEDDCKFMGNDFSTIPSTSSLSSGLLSHQQAMTAYRQLETTIRSLEGLPLQIRQMQPSGTVLRNTHIEHPTTKNQPHPPTSILLQFEGSARWPSTLPAIQMTKIAFLLKLSSLLSVIPTITSTRLGLENPHSETLNTAFLDITLSTTTFRLRIHTDREAPLLTALLASKTLTPASRLDAATSLAEYKRTFLVAPLHTSTTQKLTTQFLAYAPTVRLLTIWMNAHLLGPHFRDELLEMLALKVFLDPAPWGVPSSPMTGFLRTLAFLAKWDWQSEPLILDTSSSITRAERAAIATKFEAWRKIDPGCNRVALFVATGYGSEGVSWSEYTPSKVVAARMSGLARAADDLVKLKGLELDMGSLFKPSLREYDFVIRLRKPRSATKNAVTNGNGSVFKNLQKSHDLAPEMAGYDPIALYLEELQRVYGDAVLFFCNTIERDVIAGLWSPHTAGRRWKVNLGWSTQPLPSRDGEGNAEADGSTDVAINKEAILAEMARLGGDLVGSIEVH